MKPVSKQNLLFKDEIDITNKIKLRIPTLGEILDDEDNYYSLVTLFTATPYDLMVQLDDLGIDFTTINDYQLFLIMFDTIKEYDTKILFKDTDFSKLKLFTDDKNQRIILKDEENDVIIDPIAHEQIAEALRKINNLTKNTKKPANEEAKKYLLERARKRLRRSINKYKSDGLENIIVSLINTEQFKYNFKTVKDLTIYQFNMSLNQVVKKINYDNLMYGVYAGTIDAKKLDSKSLNWIKE